MNRHQQKTATQSRSTAAHSPGASKAAIVPSANGQPHEGERIAVLGQMKAPEDQIRLRAYQKWEAAGRPPGDGVQFWLQAEGEMLLPKKVGQA